MPSPDGGMMTQQEDCQVLQMFTLTKSNITGFHGPFRSITVAATAQAIYNIYKLIQGKILFE